MELQQVADTATAERPVAADAIAAGSHASLEYFGAGDDEPDLRPVDDADANQLESATVVDDADVGASEHLSVAAAAGAEQLAGTTVGGDVDFGAPEQLSVAAAVGAEMRDGDRAPRATSVDATEAATRPPPLTPAQARSPSPTRDQGGAAGARTLKPSDRDGLVPNDSSTANPDNNMQGSGAPALSNQLDAGSTSQLDAGSATRPDVGIVAHVGDSCERVTGPGPSTSASASTTARRTSRSAGPAYPTSRTLIEKGAEAYELTLGITRRPQDVAYRGPTLGDGRVGVKPSPIGGPGGRGLFAIKDLTTKEGILYGG